MERNLRWKWALAVRTNLFVAVYTHSNNTMNWLGVPSRMMRMCCKTGWHGATKFKMSWQLSVAGTENKHNVFDRPLCISIRSLRTDKRNSLFHSIFDLMGWTVTLTFSYTYEWYPWWPQRMDFPKKTSYRTYAPDSFDCLPLPLVSFRDYLTAKFRDFRSIAPFPNKCNYRFEWISVYVGRDVRELHENWLEHLQHLKNVKLKICGLRFHLFHQITFWFYIVFVTHIV